MFAASLVGSDASRAEGDEQSQHEHGPGHDEEHADKAIEGTVEELPHSSGPLG